MQLSFLEFKEKRVIGGQEGAERITGESDNGKKLFQSLISSEPNVRKSTDLRWSPSSPISFLCSQDKAGSLISSTRKSRDRPSSLYGSTIELIRICAARREKRLRGCETRENGIGNHRRDSARICIYETERGRPERFAYLAKGTIDVT